MKNLKRLLFSLTAFLLFNVFTSAQTKTIITLLTKTQQWQLLDYKQDTVYGMSVNKAYNELLKGKTSHPVIVAVIDEGVDIMHEDLQGHIWTNTKEIPNNGIDDDKNGYVDDIHGWNFLGGKDGKMMYVTSTEADREYYRLYPKYGLIMDSSLVTDKKEYQYFLRAKSEHISDSLYRSPNRLKRYYQLINAIKQFQNGAQKQKVFFADVNSFQPKDSANDTAKKYLMAYYKRNPPEAVTWDLDSMYNVSPDFNEYLNELEKDQPLFAELGNDPYKLRREIVGDNPFDINEKNYGNNNVEDSAYGGHGTHCSGIIAADRNNEIGINGITNNVLIMPVRVVNTMHPGDEMDKDVALGIRYAVDNGARVISMSFGKPFSPNKKWVDDAIKYAANKGVLLVHGAGNDDANNDSIPFYPYPEFLESVKAENLITVGAISEDTGFAVTADFSNYGKKEVDVFAPGVDIYSSMPDNKYASESGTSMATPMVAGVAALVLEYYPQLTVVQVKNIIMQSVTSLKGKMVYKPGTQEKVDFATLCVSGGVVNAYNALRLAEKMTAHK